MSVESETPVSKHPKPVGHDPAPPNAPGPSGNRFCCCPPKARTWIEVTSRSVFVENKIDIKRHFNTRSDASVTPDIQVDADANATTRTTATAAANPAAQSAGDSVGASRNDSHGDSHTKVDAKSDGHTTVDEFVYKNQGKIYRTDQYTVHWQAEGEGDLQVTLVLSGALQYSADWLPKSGSVTVSRSYVLEPPAYQPADAAELAARLTVTDCTNQVASQENRSARP
jgi:hypothetical protein